MNGVQSIPPSLSAQPAAHCSLFLHFKCSQPWRPLTHFCVLVKLPGHCLKHLSSPLTTWISLVTGCYSRDRCHVAGQECDRIGEDLVTKVTEVIGPRGADITGEGGSHLTQPWGPSEHLQAHPERGLALAMSRVANHQLGPQFRLRPIKERPIC